MAERVWSDEAHVVENRALYATKFRIAEELLGDLTEFRNPEAGFFLWLPVDDGEEAALRLWRETGVRVLPGAYLARTVAGQNPGAGYLRVAMVAPEPEFREGIARLRACLFD